MMRMLSRCLVFALFLGAVIFPAQVAAQNSIPFCDETSEEPVYNPETGTWDNDCQDRVIVTGQNSKSFADIVYKDIIPFIDGYVIQFLYLVAFLFFMYGVANFFLISGSEENRQKGKEFVVWGLVGLVVLFSVWGLVKLTLTSVFPNSNFDGGGQGAGNRPRGAVCESGTQCRSGVCVLRGINTSACE